MSLDTSRHNFVENFVKIYAISDCHLTFITSNKFEQQPR